ncbi:FbpB family small basic protein [Priestia abyssalis]|nr:FbpB family small basic protein [Priestia abyssalis]
MRKMRKRTFAELVMENKKQLLKDQAALDKIEERLETRMMIEKAE